MSPWSSDRAGRDGPCDGPWSVRAHVVIEWRLSQGATYSSRSQWPSVCARCPDKIWWEVLALQLELEHTMAAALNTGRSMCTNVCVCVCVCVCTWYCIEHWEVDPLCEPLREKAVGAVEGQAYELHVRSCIDSAWAHWQGCGGTAATQG